MSKMVLYGIGGMLDSYRAFRYFIMGDEYLSVFGIRGAAERMVDLDPRIQTVYAVDNRYGMRDAYIASKNATNEFEPCVLFRDILEREGMMVCRVDKFGDIRPH